MSTPLEQISEKLKRADEHIRKLEIALEAFQNAKGYAPIGNYNANEAKTFRDAWEQRPIPLRFAVIAGEIIQQFRSSLNYLHAALLIKDGGRTTGQTQFPIFISKPTTPKHIGRYKAQVGAIKRRRVLAIIKSHQPYTRRNRRTGKKWLGWLGQMSNTDKHHALVLCITVINPRINVSSVMDDEGFQFESSAPDDGAELPVGLPFGGKEFVRVVDVQRTLGAYVAFPKFGRVPYPQPVCTFLEQIGTGVRLIVSDLSPFL